jgi:2'-5' RNA ligase
MQGVFEFHRDLPARPRRPERLFFGLLPDSETSNQVSEFRERFVRKHHLGRTAVKPERLHVSLHHVGDCRRLRTRFIYAATQAARAVAMRPFAIAFRSVRSFERASSPDGGPGRRVLALLGSGEAVLELHRILGAAMVKNGLRAAPHFVPHMTLLYGAKPVPVEAIRPIRLVVDEFVLIHSELGLTRYNIVDRWPLAG